MDDTRLDMRGRFALGPERVRQARTRLPIIVPQRSVRGRSTLNLRWTQPAHRTKGTVRVPRTILAVEDDPLNLRLFHDMLTWQGFETLEAGDADRALELVADRRPDLVLLDVQLPGMSGLDLVRHFKADERMRSVPIIAVTALALRRHETLIREAGVDDFVTKPFSVTDLMQMVRRHLPADAPDPESTSRDEAEADADADEEALSPWSVAPGFSLTEPEG